MPASERKMRRSTHVRKPVIRVNSPGPTLRRPAGCRPALTEMARGDMHVAKRMPVRALSLQRMSAGEIAVILHLFDAAFNDIRANPGDVSVQRTLPGAFKPASFTRQSTTRRSHATSNR
ncbi:hypothetical protein [Burkholderia anthinoferrum]|uniref:hypothetical protein n=1 Tax=Burkholderia anthinoferrum TaxID=3090833 RepID=UPI0011B07ED5|nr:hypothetical protein [Burkholderia anthinoferrum]